MFMSKTMIWLSLLVIDAVVLIEGCQHTSDPRAAVVAPAGATDVRVVERPDGSIVEVSFSVLAERDSYLVADYLESQLQRAGYKSCGSGGRQWETLRRRRADQLVEEVRLLHF